MGDMNKLALQGRRHGKSSRAAWVVSTHDHTSYIRSSGETTPPSDDVYYSDYLDTGTAFRIELSLLPFPRQHAAGIDYDSLLKAIHAEIAKAWGIPTRYFQEDKPYRWQRSDNETIMEWGTRLSAKGLLDNPVIRWEYQKAVLSSPVNAVKRFLGKRTKGA